ncbi:MAG: phosphopyruvate hydratase [Candidatus Komeilibacteria bacterium]
MPDTIKRVSASEILDSRGNPTIEVTVELQGGLGAKASVPSGASTGSAEALELRDNDPHRYGGKGVLKACQNVDTEINRALVGIRVTEQRQIDDLMRELDNTPNKSRLGANAILGVSLACARAASKSLAVPLYQYLGDLYGNKKFTLPLPLVNVINGGLHADTNLNIQEFWIIPVQQVSFSDRLRCADEIFMKLGSILKQAGRDTDVGNEGGYSPNFDSHQQAFDYLRQAASEAGYQLGRDCYLGMDAGASVFFNSAKSTYNLQLENSEYTHDEWLDYLMNLLRTYPMLAVEDPLAEEDWTAWQVLTKQVKKEFPQLQLIGDDIFTTNVTRLQKGIDLGVANAILIKPNQIGSLSETLDCIKLAKRHGYQTAISHRSGETIDSFIADLSVAVASEFIKTGSVARGERSAKYNRLLAIEKELYGQQG